MNYYFTALQLIAIFASVVNHAYLAVDEYWWNKQFNDIKKPDVLRKIGNQLKFKLWYLNEDEDVYFKIKFTDHKLTFIKKLRKLPLKVIINGYKLSEKKEYILRMVYLNRIDQFNVISVDWSAYLHEGQYCVRTKVGLRVGIVIGYFLKYLVDQKIVLANDIHLIGNNLGAHIAGSSGRTFARLTNTKIGRITGLDPPVIFGNTWNCFTSETFLSLDRDDAMFVDVIYTSRGSQTGMTEDIGHANFLPNNGGPTQPCCNNLTIGNLKERQQCNHKMAYSYYVESVEKKSFESVRCSSNEEYMAGNCKNNPTSNMGHDANPTSHGRFYLTTNKTKPYSKFLLQSPGD